ncbi:MAG: ATP-binding protein [Phycisphaerales bacterium]
MLERVAPWAILLLGLIGAAMALRVARREVRRANEAARDAAANAARDRDATLDRLERTTREQQAILESMSSGLLAIDPDQHLLRVNSAAATMLGIDDPDAVRGRLVQAVVRQPGLNRFLAEAIDAEGPTEAEFVIERVGRGGRAERGEPVRLTVQAVSEPLRDAAGHPAGLLVSLSDVTRIRRLESLRVDFAANVSHELRTPITNIKGYVETMLQVGVDDPEQSRRFLEIIRRNAQRLGAIIEDLLALARLEQPGGRETLEAVDAPLRQIVESARLHLEPAAQAKEIAIAVDVPSDLVMHVMPSLVEQAVANLVANAITYSPAGSTVRIVGAARDDGMAELSVIDNGPGIAPHHLPRIFERFYRIDKARSRDHGGTGLGLAIVKHIALAHGGRIDVESKPGAGSTFRLVLPAETVGAAQMAG